MANLLKETITFFVSFRPFVFPPDWNILPSRGSIILNFQKNRVSFKFENANWNLNLKHMYIYDNNLLTYFLSDIFDTKFLEKTEQTYLTFNNLFGRIVTLKS